MRSVRDNITGLYAHIPFCDGKCGYCAFYSVIYQFDLAERLLAALARELSEWGCLSPATIYIGGGTPSLLTPAQLQKLGGLLGAHIDRKNLVEWSVEVNPGSITTAKAEALAACGVNRVSIGAQSFDDNVLAFLGRRHKTADIARAFGLLRDCAFENIGLDLIAGVPGVTARQWHAILERALELTPRHVSVYALTLEEGTRLSRAAGNGEIFALSDDLQLEMLDQAEEILGRSGLRRYEISNYALPGCECRHNLACWKGEQYLGLGPAAASHCGLRRWINRPDLGVYLKAFETGQKPPREEELLTAAMKRKERLIFGLRMAEGVEAELAGGCEHILRRLAVDGLTVLCGTRWVLTKRGRNLADYVAVELLQDDFAV